LTGVPLDRLKVMGLGAGLLKDDVDISSLKVKENAQVKLLGTAEVLVEPQEKTVFAEDIAGDENADAIMNSYSAGLVNMGNTCYANASLQSLRIIPELRDELNKYQGASNSQNDLSEYSIVERLVERYGQVKQRWCQTIPILECIQTCISSV